MIQAKCSDEVWNYQTCCTQMCDQELKCTHLCQGVCGECYGGYIHAECKEKCERVLVVNRFEFLIKKKSRDSKKI